MPSHPRIEEVEDSDVELSDPSEGDIDDFAPSDIIRRVEPKQEAPPQATPAARPQNLNPRGGPEFQTTSNTAAYADFQCLYPVYFDASRSRAEGRRVSKGLAVKNPLAAEIVHACAALRLQTLFEPTKLHPKDWANPGRVKVQLKPKDGKTQASVKNKHHLYVLVAKHLQAHPTTEDGSALRYRVAGMPLPPTDKPWPRPAIPRGWKMGELLPYYSPAMTGGGVSENFLKDMMKEMQGGGDMASLMAGAASGSGGAAGGEEKKKKDKKGKGKG